LFSPGTKFLPAKPGTLVAPMACSQASCMLHPWAWPVQKPRTVPYSALMRINRVQTQPGRSQRVFTLPGKYIGMATLALSQSGHQTGPSGPEDFGELSAGLFELMHPDVSSSRSEEVLKNVPTCRDSARVSQIGKRRGALASGASWGHVTKRK